MAGDCFSQVHVVLDYLLPWLQPLGILLSMLTADTVLIDTQRSTLAEDALPDAAARRVRAG